ncbi:TPA: hypothetical protein ACHIYU_001442 [Pseudomonas aeruginosa]|uniref:hypothetical protein n=1 Tax=Pseudomonas aeruginosa group TaxID=136841 RepID=UPI00106B7F3C|nr:hypothetical protein [Pseudomonas aeruginosa]EJB8384337.1 hypothetical protein [Pseudomonas aeruginosa]MDG4130565.1 hypothetical protein [Pseudomonas aeruginosa]MDV8063861.1 hypothetical protein [Pseudomonas aeruginosa]MDV8091504.1 hypothetical protein [Pseudomonas aeruginosa]MED5084612.1 hypothetical protein [Pseudomonas aeruginosa]
MSMEEHDSKDLSQGPAPEVPLFDGLRQRWEKEQLEEAATRRAQRGWMFCTVYVVVLMLFFTFGAYVWHCIQTKAVVDHWLLWLLAALPVGLTLLLARLSAEPKPDDQKISWPDGLVGVAGEAINVLKEYVSTLKK